MGRKSLILIGVVLATAAAAAYYWLWAPTPCSCMYRSYYFDHQSQCEKVLAGITYEQHNELEVTCPCDHKHALPTLYIDHLHTNCPCGIEENDAAPKDMLLRYESDGAPIYLEVFHPVE